MVTLNELIQARQEMRSGVPKANPCQLKKVFGLPSMNVIAIYAHFQRMTDKGPARIKDGSINAPHTTLLMFKSLEFSDEQENDLPICFEILPGTFVYSERPSASSTRVAVNCTCSDYYFAWGVWNSREGAYAGVSLKTYKRVTPPPPEGHPYKNPNQIPGLCKHIFYLAEKLASSNNWLAP